MILYAVISEECFIMNEVFVSFPVNRLREQIKGYMHVSKPVKPTNTHFTVSCDISLYHDTKEIIYRYM